MAGGPQAARAEPLEDDGAPVHGAAAQERLREMVVEHFQFVWRTLRRMVPAEAVDDGVQRVFMVASRKVDLIAPGSERAFLFKTALWVAQLIRRTRSRRRETVGGEGLDDLRDPAPLPDETADWNLRRRLLDEVLDGMTAELRQVFVLFEIEGLPITEIAGLVGVPTGTVCSRLRRAREQFHARANRVRARGPSRGAR
jgi:RNA polymerase sigma-70 factor, ECF subfamily